jgi:hypothetical protein
MKKDVKYVPIKEFINKYLIVIIYVLSILLMGLFAVVCMFMGWSTVPSS